MGATFAHDRPAPTPDDAPVAAPPNPIMSLAEQALFIKALHRRTVMSDGAIAGMTYAALSKEDADKLMTLAYRLERMAPHERAIRRVVTGE